METDIGKAVGKNYKEFWDFKGRYRVVKGGRGSKKSHTAALWYIYHLLKYENSNLLCMRQFYNSLKDSQFAELKKAAKRLGVYHLFEFKVSPLEITLKHTGQKVLFRGFDNPDSVTSITVSTGYLCWVWIEEAYQVADEEDFNKLDFSVRGIADERLFPQITLTLNPWSEMWIKTRFFDVKSPDILALTRNYYHNEFLSPEDISMFEELKERDPSAYRIVGEGEWGIEKGAYFSEFTSRIHTSEPFDIRDSGTYNHYASFDYGLDMFACLFYAVDRFGRVFVYREIHQSNLIVSEAADKLAGYISPDSVLGVYAPPDMWNRQRESGKSIADIFAAKNIPLIKASNNRINGWLCVKEQMKVYKENGEEKSSLVIFKNCENLINALPRLLRDEKNPSDVSIHPHNITHAPDALRYFLGSMFMLPQKENVREFVDETAYFGKHREEENEIPEDYVREFTK